MIEPGEWFGSFADGLSDDTQAWQRALDAVPSGGCLIPPPGIYKITSQLTINKSIDINAPGVTLLCPTGFSSGQVFLFSGSNSYKGFLSSAASFGENTVFFNASGVSPGDWLFLVSDHLSDVLEYSGEDKKSSGFFKVRSLAGSEVKLSERTKTPFSANAEVFRQSFIRPKIRGLKIIMDPSYLAWGINAFNTESLLLDDVTIYNAGLGGVAINRSIKPQLRNCNFANIGTQSSNRYGVLFQDCENMLVSHSDIDCTAWHAIAVGGFNASFNLIVENSRLSNGSTASVVDFHSNCRFVNIINNDICGYGGISLRGPDFLVGGNTIIADWAALFAMAGDIKWLIGRIENNKMFVKNYVIDSENSGIDKVDLTFKGNKIISQDGGVLIWPNKANAIYDKFNFIENRLELPNVAGKHRIQGPITPNNTRFRSIVIQNNEFVGGDVCKLNIPMDHLKYSENTLIDTSFGDYDLGGNPDSSFERNLILE